MGRWDNAPLPHAVRIDDLPRFRNWRDGAIGGLMLLSGLRSAEVLGLRVSDVDIARRWVRVLGKGGKERSGPIDTDVAGAIPAG